MSELSLTGLRKAFGDVTAVADVTIGFAPGEIHAVLGENGAGKSTLLRMGAGLLPPDEGEVRVDGRALAPHTPGEAQRRGVAMVQQHFALVAPFDAVDNAMLGVEGTRGLGRLDRKRARTRLAELARELGLDVPLDVPASELSVGQQQSVEILRSLYREARVLILDEPTAVLARAEADALYGLLGKLAAGGRAIVVVTHKLDEVHAHAHRVSVLRRGRLVDARVVDRARPPKEELAALTRAVMGEGETGAPSMPPPASVPPQEPARGAERTVGAYAVGSAPLLALEGVAAGARLTDATLEVRAGEIVGVAGVEGNGQDELVQVLGGQMRPTRGAVRAVPATVVYGDRHREGVVLDASVAENLTLGELAAFARRGWLDLGAWAEEARRRVARGGIVPADITLPVRALSGGNQQKIVIERAVAAVERGVRLVVMAHPTRGVDIRAAAAIHGAVRRLREHGCAVLVLSADLAELRALSDRLLVLSRGRIAVELPPTATDDEVGHVMLGAAGHAA
jgi:simple sugar transport system ATP-binding protein